MDKNQPACVFNSDPPNLNQSEIIDLLSCYYSINNAQLTPLVSERDQNFLVSTSLGKFVLKISNIAEDPLSHRSADPSAYAFE